MYDEETISFFRAPNNRVIVHNSSINPCEYSFSSLQGFGLRDADMVLAFANFLKRKISERSTNISYVCSTNGSVDDLINSLDEFPIQEIFNVIYCTLYPRMKLNDKGYAEVESLNIATKIWSLVSDWQSLVTKEVSPKQLVLGLQIHRLTGKKEVAQVLSKLGHASSYDFILKVNTFWSENTPAAHLRFRNVSSLHLTLDNNDIVHDNLTGANSTHDTNQAIFLPLSIAEDRQCYIRPIDDLVNARKAKPLNIVPYYHGKRKDPEQFPTYHDDKNKNILGDCFRKDVLWALAGCVGPASDDPKDLLGSWTAFNRSVSFIEKQKSIFEYQAVTSMPPNFPVCKSYLESVAEIMEDLGLEFAFVHADEDILCKLYQIIWNHQDEQFKFIRLIMGGFHQIKVLLKIISKIHSCMGYEQWFVESGLIQAGSVETGFNGKKYYRTMRLLKAAFCTLIQFRFKSLKCADFELLDNGLLSQIVSLKINTQKSTCDAIFSSPAFSQLCNELTRVSGT